MAIKDNPSFEQLVAILQRAERLVADEIPEPRKNISVGELDVSMRIANILFNSGVSTIWDLVHMREAKFGRWRSFNSKPRTMELIDAIDQAIKVLTGEMQLQKHEAKVNIGVSAKNESDITENKQ